jgi:hypothetical protein
LDALGRVLASRRLAYDLVTVGGSSLMLLGLIERPTRDLDVIAVIESGRYVKASSLPAPLVQAVAEVGQVLQLGPDWINAGPADLLDFGLPKGFAGRTEVRRYGPLTLHIAARVDQVALKLYATADLGRRSKHFQDLQELQPTREELVAGARWAVTQDPSEGFRSLLVNALAAMEVADGDSFV